MHQKNESEADWALAVFVTKILLISNSCNILAFYELYTTLNVCKITNVGIQIIAMVSSLMLGLSLATPLCIGS